MLYWSRCYGFDYIDFPKSELGICWVYGKEEEIMLINEGIDIIHQCNERLKEDEMYHVHDKNNTCFAFERYSSPRFTTPDENGNIILDMCCFLNFYY